MKLVNKISLLTLFLLTVFGINSFIGLRQIFKVGTELRNVTNRDIALTAIITSITHWQLEKAVFFERAVRISEEIAFEEISPAREKHLFDYAKLTKKGFDKLAQLGALKIIEGKRNIQEGIKSSKFLDVKEGLKHASDVLSEIEKAHIYYDSLVGEIFTLINAGSYQLSFEDIKKIRKGQNDLAVELKALLKEVQGFTGNSLSKAKHSEQIARKILWLSLFVSVFISSIFAFSIIRSISHPLKRLVKATHQIGVGDFVVCLDESSKDEIGEVSAAFNAMAGELLEFKKKLEDKNQMLAKNLEITNAQRKDLEKINQELDSFVHTVSHDIKTPLTGIAGYGAFLEKHHSDKLDKKGKECLSGIRKAADHLNFLIQDLLALTRISRIRNPYGDIDPNTLITVVKERLEFDIKKFNVDFNIPQKMPIIRCDGIKLGEVFLNLINNAIKFFSKNNKEHPKIEIGYKDKGDFHEIYVRDNGIGIDPKYHKEVFGIFKRLHDEDEYKGTGAGLSIVKSIIDEHGGKIWIDSQLGAGATFYFTIPKKLRMMAKNGAKKEEMITNKDSIS